MVHLTWKTEDYVNRIIVNDLMFWKRTKKKERKRKDFYLDKRKKEGYILMSFIILYHKREKKHRQGKENSSIKLIDYFLRQIYDLSQFSDYSFTLKKNLTI